MNTTETLQKWARRGYIEPEMVAAIAADLDARIEDAAREVPVPELPTEPYTVIRATLRDEKPDVFVLRDDLTGYETAWVSLSWTLDPEIAAERITSFVVLSEPRAVTAKAVLDRVRDEGILRNSNAHDVADEIGTEFGVGS